MIPVFQQAFLKGGGTQFLGFLHVFNAKGRGESYRDRGKLLPSVSCLLEHCM